MFSKMGSFRSRQPRLNEFVFTLLLVVKGFASDLQFVFQTFDSADSSYCKGVFDIVEKAEKLKKATVTGVAAVLLIICLKAFLHNIRPERV